MQKEMKAANAAEYARHGKKSRGDELPPDLRSKRERLTLLQETKERLELAAIAAAHLAQESKLAKQAEEEQQSGKKKPGRKPASPDAVVGHDHMRTPRGLRAGS